LSFDRVNNVARPFVPSDGGQVTGSRQILMAGTLLLLTACAAPAPTRADGNTPAPPPAVSSVSTVSASPDPAAVGANELGDVPVLMYHRIVARPKSVYDRTPTDFQAELERLAGERYVPVTASEYTAGRIDIPAGTHPVVLTFDDGDASQFALDSSGVPAPGTAVAILREVATRHPEFRPVATFYVNRDPFGDPGGGRTLPWLRDHGMDIGNHTMDHTNLGKASADEVQREIADNDAMIRRGAPGVEPSTIALPFGIHPRTAGLALAGATYHYRGAFLVGANPAPSPFSADFAPDRIPRIRSQGTDGPDAKFASTAWLDKLAASPSRRYTSDGVPDHVAYPRSASQSVAGAYEGRARPY
jgi:peptidoglycan/xylan/chitin deacetylase (PgdA/CDA1 family)